MKWMMICVSRHKQVVGGQKTSGIHEEENLLTQKSFSEMSLQLKGDQVLSYKSECNQEWTYLFQGQDWNCECSVGGNQSPIDLCQGGASKSTSHHYVFDIFDRYQQSRQNKVEITNTGKTIKLEFRFGSVSAVEKTISHNYQVGDNPPPIPIQSNGQLFPIGYSKDFPQ